MKTYLNNSNVTNSSLDLFDELPLWSAPFGLKLLDYIDYKENIAALDIGFGCGFPLIEIAMRLDKNSIIYGIDPWKEAVERTKNKVNSYGINNVKLIQGVAENILLENQSLDLITSNNGINNVSDTGKVLAECARILKAGGQFVQTMNTELSMLEFYNALEFVLLDMGMYKEIEVMKQHIAQKRPSINGFIKKMNEQGFVIKDMEQTQFNYKFVNGTTMLNHHFIRLAFLGAWKKLVPENEIANVFNKVELHLNIQARLLGGLTLSVPFVLINAIKN